MKHAKLFFIIATILVFFAFGQDQKTNTNKTIYTQVLNYDPARDAAHDILNAQAEAKRTGRNVLVEVGGNWCSWCAVMHKFYSNHSALLALREKNYVTVLVNMSRSNENKEVLSRYKGITGYPHLLVLDAEGKLLCSQHTSELEDGSTYNIKKFTGFLEKWESVIKKSK